METIPKSKSRYIHFLVIVLLIAFIAWLLFAPSGHTRKARNLALEYVPNPSSVTWVGDEIDHHWSYVEKSAK